MLVICPECNLKISDKALQCPHCGYPMIQKESKPRKKRSHKRLPNGFGQISKINKPLARPYRAMVTVGKSETGRPIVKPLKPKAYFATYNEAYEALLKYNKDRKASDLTLTELYAKWSTEYYESITPASIRSYQQAWRRAEKYHNKNIKDIGTIQIREVIDSVSLSVKPKVLYLFSLMFDYAVQYEYLDKNVARNLKLPRSVLRETEAERKTHIDFTNEEMATLWKHKGDPYVAMILMQCYMGWRPQEMLNITQSDCDLTNWTITGGLKTSAGIDRVVPVHPAIRQIVADKYNNADSLGRLFPFTYQTYHARFKETMGKYGLSTEHRPHDPRKQFVTMAKEADVNEYAIKRIVGHSISDITEKVYTNRPISWLMEEITKISV